MQICPKCDFSNPPDVRFCGNCGAALSPNASSPNAQTASSNQTPPVLSPQVVNQPVNVNVTVQAPQPAPPASVSTIILTNQIGGPGCVTRALYFVFIGWWFSQIWILLAWFFNLTILGLPLGLMMINRLPQVTTLKPPRKQTQVTVVGNMVLVTQGGVEQYPFLARAIYFVLVGWWFSLVWAELAWALAVTVIGMPLAFWMFDRVPAITTLART